MASALAAPRALYSCNLSSVGRTTHAEGTAGAHLLYIGRESAASELMAGHMPADPQQARTWMDRLERDARKNARLCDKIRLALPRQLDREQRAQLVRDYAQALTGGRVPWYAAIHQDGKDAHNPHVHLVLVDRDIESGKRLLCLSDSKRDWQKKGRAEPSPVEWVRERWEHEANRALERAGRHERMDRRSLAAQGIDRTPQIHIGPRAQHIDTKVSRPQSKAVPAPTARHPDRVIDYPLIDAGRTRRERNAEIIDLNIERDARSPHFETRVLARFEREQRAQDRLVEARLIAGARRRTLEERRIRRSAAAQRREVRARRDAEARFTRDWLRQRHLPETQALRQRQAAERTNLRKQQDRLFARFFTALDLTGRTRRKRDAARLALSARHKGERATLAGRIRADRHTQAQAVTARYAPELAEITRQRTQKLDGLRERHEQELRGEDALMQQREAEREQGRAAIREQIDNWKRSQRQTEERSPDAAERSPARSRTSQAFDRAQEQDQEAEPAPRDETEDEKRLRLRREMEEARRRRERDRSRDRD